MARLGKMSKIIQQNNVGEIFLAKNKKTLTRARMSISFKMSGVVSLVKLITLIATFSPVSRFTPNLTSA
jgi:hypothetical protein